MGTLIVQDDSGKMQLKLWKTDCDKFAFMEEDKVYRISGTQLKPVDKKWNKTGTDYEMHSSQSTQISESVAKVEIAYNFQKLKDIQNVETETSVDCVGILHDVENATEITFQASQRTSFRRNITLCDDSHTLMRVTMWGKNAENFQGERGMAV